MVREGKEARSKFTWPQLTKEYTFTTVASQDSYSLPADIDHFHFRTMWDRTNRWELVGPLSAQEWQLRKSGIAYSSPRRRFRIKGCATKQFYVDPTPGATEAGQTLVFEYQSKSWVKPRTWTATTSYTTNSFTFYNGNIYFSANGGTTGTTPPTHTSSSASDGGVTWTYYSDPYEDFGADTDESCLPEDVIMLGTKWRFMQQKGLPNWEELKMQYLETISRESSKIIGARTLSLAKRQTTFLLSPISIPDTGFGA